jgi:excinuclease ABC subunit B
MESAARDLDFTAAARYRDQMYALQEKQKSMQKK